MKKNLIGLIALVVVLAGCASKVQTTSGREYLAKYPDVAAAPRTKDGAPFGGRDIDKMIREAAAVEPTLKFPARIGLARIEEGRLAVVPPEEMEAWQKAQAGLGSGFGEFIPLNPMIVKMVSGAISDGRGYYERGIEGVITEIRLGAARQHLDAVFIYEEYSKEKSSDNILSFGKLTLLGGYLLPSENHEAQGFANGMLIDVIQGYPYGTAQTVVEKQTRLASAWGWGSDYSSEKTLAEKVRIQAGRQLADEAAGMFVKLRSELAARKPR